MKLKQEPHDFQVEELTDVTPGEGGAFALYRLEKTGWTTPDALSAIRRRSAQVRSKGDDSGQLREGPAPGTHDSVRIRPGSAEKREEHPARPLGRLGHLPGASPPRPRPQPDRLSARSRRRLSWRPRP